MHWFLFLLALWPALAHVLARSMWTLSPGCCTGLDFNMEQTLWAVAFIPALLKTQLDFLHGERDWDGTVEGIPLKLTSSAKLSMKPQPLVAASGHYFICGTLRTPLPSLTISTISIFKPPFSISPTVLCVLPLEAIVNYAQEYQVKILWDSGSVIWGLLGLHDTQRIHKVKIIFIKTLRLCLLLPLLSSHKWWVEFPRPQVVTHGGLNENSAIFPLARYWKDLQKCEKKKVTLVSLKSCFEK